ncbi:MAG: LamG-like jellyroll fold domain-containing protein [Kiritimatiellia bacterium]
MKVYWQFVLGCVAAVCAASAEVVSFPGCPWSETRVVSEGGRVRVVNAAGRNLLAFDTEGGPFGKHLVVSQAVDHLVIDARAAFDAGMAKLVFTSANFDPKPYRGVDCTLQTELGGVRGTEVVTYFEGHGPNLHYYRNRKVETKGHRKVYPFVALVSDQVQTLHLRWDLTKAAKEGPLAFYGARYATLAELPVQTERRRVAPELLFHAPFDGTAEAVRAKGAKAPRRAEGLEFAEGRFGKAVRLTERAKSVLEYEAKGNLVPERGTVSLWFKREWADRGRRPDGGEKWRVLFANEPPKGERIGSGRLWFWWWGDRFRADQSDDDDAYQMWSGPSPARDEWTHLAVSWDEAGVRVYMNGTGGRTASDGESPMIAALKARDLLTFNRQVFTSFFVGGQGDGQQFDGLIDDLRIYSAPLSDEQIREIWRRASVIEIKAAGCYSLADTQHTVSVTATSPGGCDLGGLKYCICDASGTVVARYRNAVGPKEAKLLVNLPAGDYEIRATDGTWFYGCVPYSVLRCDNPYELTGEAAREALRAPGVLGNLELVQSLKMDRALDAARFRAVGPVTTKRLGGTTYLEAGPNTGDRYALRFNITTNTPLWVFEIDYPDDARRTADLIIQKSRQSSSDYTMQVGYAAGDEYPNTGRILTHRVLYWASDPDVTLVVMTARKGAPAAVSAVRVYRVRGAALPAAEIHEPEPVPPPSGLARAWNDFQAFNADRLDARQSRMGREAERAGWNRTVALYFEDPAIGYDFAVSKSNGYLPEELDDLIDRTAALMKFTGENLFAYPGAWYHGLIGEAYNPRHHAPDFLSAWYAKFDREGLGLMPTVNPNTMPVPDGLVTRASMSDGSLHDTVIAIHDTGRPNWGGWHDTPPNFNFHHPKVRRHIAGIIEALVEQGADHPSFKGVCMHLTRHCLLWFGDEESGYNDYTVEAFAKAKGLEIPADAKTGALRGRAYAKWLRATAWDEWLRWRCDIVTDFYVKEARKLAARRPDLKLWLNYMVPANARHPDFTRPDFMTLAWRGAGLDPVRITKEAPNVILGQTMVPADYRWAGEGHYASPAARDHQRVLDTLPGFYANLRGAAYPLVHQHDRYWESPIGAGTKGTLSCEWLRECAWRVSTINPSGVHALRHFVEPLRFGDVLGLSKGGFLIGTYGMEAELVPFIQAFRALPAVVMEDVAAVGDVRVRACTFRGRTYFYVVNTAARAATVTVEMPAKTRDLVSGERFGDGLFGGDATSPTLKLGPYQMRSFSAPSGRPALR